MVTVFDHKDTNNILYYFNSPQIEFELKLINEIKKRPCLYNEKNEGKLPSSVISRAWKEVHYKVDSSSVEVCQKVWNNLKNNYKKHHDNVVSNRSNNVTWIHYETIKSLEVQNILDNDKGNKQNDREKNFEKSVEKELVCQQSVQDFYNKCGEIKISNNKEFKFVCCICHEEHNAIEAFSSHVLEIHFFHKNLIEYENHIPKSVETDCSVEDIHLNDNSFLANEQIAKNLKNDMLPDTLKKNDDKQPDIEENNSNASKTNIKDKTSRELQELSDNCRITESKKKCEAKCIFPWIQCRLIFKDQLNEHRRLHGNMERPRPHRCLVCGKEYKRNRSLKSHILKDHSKDRLPSSTVKDLHKILQTNDLPFQCQDCGKCFPLNSYLTAHRYAWHIDKTKFRHKCQFCEKTFYSKLNLKSHSYMHTGERPYACSMCSQRFIKPESVEEHMKTHSGERKYICHICKAAFNQIADLIQHKKIHKKLLNMYIYHSSYFRLKRRRK